MRKLAAVVGCLGAVLVWPVAAAASPLSQVAEVVAPGTGEALGAVAISGNEVFAAASRAAFSAQGQGAVFVFSPPATGWSGSPHEVAVLTAASPSGGEGLGTSVHAEGNVVVAGTQTGPAYVFVQPAGGWSGAVHEAARLSASNGDRLVDPVVSGSLIVARGVNDSGGSSVYVFVEPAGGWSGTLHESARLVPSDGYPGDEFGASVAVSGQTVVAGAPAAKVGSQVEGAAYVFNPPAGGWSGTVREAAKLTGSDVHPDGFAPFGGEVAISGTTIVATVPAGARSQDGAEYVFVEPPGGWHSATESAKLVAPDGLLLAGQDILPGPTLSISGATIAVSGGLANYTGRNPGRVFVYSEPAGGWSGTLAESARLVASDAGALDYPTVVGQTVVAGEVGAASGQTVVGAGPTYVFQEPPGGWSGTLSQGAELTPAVTPGSIGLFAEPAGGWSNAPATAILTPSGDAQPVDFDTVSASGQNAVASGGGVAEVFTSPVPDWTGARPAARLTDSAGAPLGGAATSGATAAAIAGPGTGPNRIDVFTEPAGGWTGAPAEAATLTASDGTAFQAVALDGTTIVAVGSVPGHETGYVFTEPAGGWSGSTHETARLSLPYLPMARPITVQGSTIVVDGAISGDTVVSSGTAYVFTQPAAGWSGTISPGATLTAPSYDLGYRVYVEPRTGWSGTVGPAARLLGGFGSATISGSTVALVSVNYPASRYDFCPCSADVRLFTRPRGGWSGLLSAPVSLSGETDNEGGPLPLAMDGATLFAGGQAVSEYSQETSLGVFAITGPILESPVPNGRPSGHVRASGLTTGRPKVALTLTAGSYAPPVSSFTVWLPRGLRFGRHVLRGVVRSFGPFTARVRRGGLTIRLRFASEALVVKLRPSALVESRALRRRVQQARRHHHRLRLRFVLRITDAAGHPTRVSVVVVL